MLGFLGGSPGLVAHLAGKPSAGCSSSEEIRRLQSEESMGLKLGTKVSEHGSDPMKGLNLLAIWPSVSGNRKEGSGTRRNSRWKASTCWRYHQDNWNMSLPPNVDLKATLSLKNLLSDGRGVAFKVKTSAVNRWGA